MPSLNNDPLRGSESPDRSPVQEMPTSRLSRIWMSLRLLHNRWPSLRKVSSAILLAGGLLFMIRALRGQIAELASTAIAVPAWAYPALTLLATLTTLVTAALHAVVVASETMTPIDRARVRYAYAVSQLARYVPGKVFGVILETQMLAPSLSLRRVVSATLLQTLLIYAWASVVAIALLTALATGSARPVALAPTALALLWIAQRNRWLDRLKFVLKSRDSDSDGPLIATAQSRRCALESSMLLVLQWIPFFCIWIILVGPSQGIAAALWLGASYLLASMGGSLLVLVPSGLIVREAAFVWLGGLGPYDLTASMLVAWAVIVRLALTLADLLTVPLLWAANRKRAQK